MDLDKVLFIAGQRRFPSVQIRAIDVATRLGTPVYIEPYSAEEIPRSFQIFVCVKPAVNPKLIEDLSKRGVVVWDIVDVPPPPSAQVCIASTREAQRMFASKKRRVDLIRHHHCNFEGWPRPRGRRPGWIGSRHWKPELRGVDYDYYDVRKMSQTDVISAHRKIGIGLNLRSEHPDATAHAKLSSGIKLINCLGFGIPSISNTEAGYIEIGDGCTIYCDNNSECGRLISFLQDEPEYYATLAKNAAALGQEFTIGKTVERYRALLKSL